jgi:hypothetical protein
MSTQPKEARSNALACIFAVTYQAALSLWRGFDAGASS